MRNFPTGSLPPWRVRRALSYVEANIDQRITAADLAREVNLSTSHFSRAFRRTLGTTVHAYVMGRRVERARSLMANSPATLSDIAVRCGLSDQSHLTRWFRRVVGATPARWRRGEREQQRIAAPGARHLPGVDLWTMPGSVARVRSR